MPSLAVAPTIAVAPSLPGHRPSDDVACGAIPPDPAAVVTALARALAAAHDGVHPGLHVERLDLLDPAGAIEEVAAAVDSGWIPPPGSPYERVAPGRLLEVLGAGAERVLQRSGRPVPTVGRATVANLHARAATGHGSGPPAGDIAVAANITLRRRAASAPTQSFVDLSDAASSDPHRDLAVAAADVVATFGAGAVLAFAEAYTTARPSFDQIDPVLLDWWSMVAAVLTPVLASSAITPSAAPVTATGSSPPAP